MQFDVHKNENPTSRESFPCLVDVQADLLADLETRVAIPLATEASYAGRMLKGLMPVLRIKGKAYVAVASLVAGIPKRALGSKVADVTEYRAELVAALDLLLTGV